MRGGWNWLRTLSIRRLLYAFGLPFQEFSSLVCQLPNPRIFQISPLQRPCLILEISMFIENCKLEEKFDLWFPDFFSNSA
jgi:hypothetical protein